MEAYLMEQGSQAWHEFRLGKVSASRVADVMAKIKSGESASRRNYKMELLCQRLTGKREEGFVSGPMMRGTELEPIARGTYEGETGMMVEEVGCIAHPIIENLIASPDGLVGDDGMTEYKCPNTATMIEFIQTELIPGNYQWQMTCQMSCAGREWCDFVMFDDRLPQQLQYRCVRYHLDKNKEAEMLKEVSLFLDELEKLENEMRSIMEKSQ